jgi:hypothetical protein
MTISFLRSIAVGWLIGWLASQSFSYGNRYFEDSNHDLLEGLMKVNLTLNT